MTALLKKKKTSSSGRARTNKEKPLKRFLYKILLSVTVFFAITLLMSYLAVHIDPEDLSLFAFFGLAYPYLLLINIIIAIAWTMRLKYIAFIPLAVIIAGSTHFSNYIQLFKTKADKSDTFTVLSYNVRMFNFFEGVKERDSRKNVFAFIKAQKPDIFCMQEFFVSGEPGRASQSVNSSTGLNYYSHIKVLGSGKNMYYGIATFSRFPIIKKGEIVHPKSSSLTTYSDIVIQKDTFRVYNNHLQSFRLRKMERSFIEEITLDDRETIGEMKNLYSRLKRGFVSRSKQARALKEHMKKSPYPVIVIGDFNDTPVSFVYRKIRKGLDDSFVNSGYGAGFTYKGNYPPNRIDYILYDEGLENSYFEIKKVRYSDHYPVMAYFRKAVRKGDS